VSLLLGVIGTVGLGAVILMLVILARLTQRWELVTRSRSHYRWFYVAAALVAVSSFVRLVRISNVHSALGPGVSPMPSLFQDPQSWFYLCFYHLPLAVAVTISLVLTWRNWGWLVRGRDG
jgi:cobalamin synthase